jgi:hypothetical protein
MEDDDAIPVIGPYRGVPLENQQSPERLALVRREIDVVLGMADPGELARWADAPSHSPESRQLACAMAESMWTIAAETRANRPPLDLERLRGSTAGLGSRRWRDPWHFCSLLDDNATAVPRPKPLPDPE